jgi:hypothetical protein
MEVGPAIAKAAISVADVFNLKSGEVKRRSTC